MIRRALKAGVRLRGLAPEMLIADAVVAAVYAELGAVECMITSGSDGDHAAGSLHHAGLALDYRRWSLRRDGGGDVERDDAREAVTRLRERLPGFDVVLESTHIHVEYDPK